MVSFSVKRENWGRREYITSAGTSIGVMVRKEGTDHGHTRHVWGHHARDSPRWNSRLQKKRVENDGEGDSFSFPFLYSD